MNRCTRGSGAAVSRCRGSLVLSVQVFPLAIGLSLSLARSTPLIDS